MNVTGIKFIVITDPNGSSEELLLKKLYEIYSDFALKNPFYSLVWICQSGKTIIYSSSIK